MKGDPMAKKKKAVRTIEKDVKKAIHKGVSEQAVGNAVESAITEAADKTGEKPKHDSRVAKTARKAVADND
jgi:hypothetical protein